MKRHICWTTEHAASSYGQAVPVDVATGEALNLVDLTPAELATRTCPLCGQSRDPRNNPPPRDPEHPPIACPDCWCSVEDEEHDELVALVEVQLESACGPRVLYPSGLEDHEIDAALPAGWERSETSPYKITEHMGVTYWSAPLVRVGR